METVGWNQMPARVRMFAARHYLVHGKTVQDAQAEARYKPALDVLDGRSVKPMRDSAEMIRMFFPAADDTMILCSLGLCRHCGSAFDDAGNCRCQD